MLITREQWDHIADSLSAAVLGEVRDALNKGVKVMVKDAGLSPYKEFIEHQQFEAEYRKKLREKTGD